jgi:hypothetical protein
MDISPKTKEGIVDINIQEESHVEEILRELIQRFGDQNSYVQLKQFLVEALERKAAFNEIQFYEFNYQLNQENCVSLEQAISKIKGHEVWFESNQSKLHIYYKNINN